MAAAKKQQQQGVDGDLFVSVQLQDGDGDEGSSWDAPPPSAPPPYDLALSAPRPADGQGQPLSSGLSPATVRTAEGLPASYFASPTARAGGVSSFASFRRMHPVHQALAVFVLAFFLTVVVGMIVGISFHINSAVHWNGKHWR